MSMNHLTVEVFKNSFLLKRVYGQVWEILNERRRFDITDVFFSKTIERSRLSCSCAIESAFNGYDATFGIVLHVIRENHQLGNVDETAEFLVWESL